MKRLYRSNSNRMVAGIFGGLSDYLNIDATVLRLLFIIGLFFSVFTLALVYVVAAVIIPNEREVH
ncbi:phage shock protein C [Virgibacillus halotolerans]|uniref:PspC domain-containing protein n=1 Tax=Virgibacillus halotolerans TaxID=1071053 RepID=UPI001960DF23|nr:phage shock protein C [Virgibacillus halotolerans]